jgi:hypothetical protein
MDALCNREQQEREGEIEMLEWSRICRTIKENTAYKGLIICQVKWQRVKGVFKDAKQDVCVNYKDGKGMIMVYTRTARLTNKKPVLGYN